jgi:hypothetical protein
MPEERIMKKVFSDIPKGKSFFGKPRKIWLDDVENYQNKMDVRGWSRTANDTDARRFILHRGQVSTCKAESAERKKHLYGADREYLYFETFISS